MRRSSFLSLHRWVALAFAPFLLLQALTGSILVIHDALLASDPGTNHPITSVSVLTTGATDALPGFRVVRLYMPGAQTNTPFAELIDPRGRRAYATLDPASGHALRTGSLWAFPAAAALQLHHGLADGRIGMAVVLGNGLALMMLAGSGLFFWWPGRKKALRSLVVRPNLPGRFRLRQWHKSVGVTLSIIVIFSAATGVLMVAPDLVAPGGTASTLFPNWTTTQVEQAVAVARPRFPRARLHDIRFPATNRIDVSFFAPERNSRALHVVSVRPSDGAIVETLPAARNKALWMTVMPLHAGDRFGTAGTVTLLVEAGGILFLACAGVTMWIQSPKKKKKKAR